MRTALPGSSPQPRTPRLQPLRCGGARTARAPARPHPPLAGPRGSFSPLGWGLQAPAFPLAHGVPRVCPLRLCGNPGCLGGHGLPIPGGSGESPGNPKSACSVGTQLVGPALSSSPALAVLTPASPVVAPRLGTGGPRAQSSPQTQTMSLAGDSRAGTAQNCPRGPHEQGSMPYAAWEASSWLPRLGTP